jgi:predicted transcriptional regulator
MTMAKARRRRPTDAELAILRVLWREGPSTVRQVFDGLADPPGSYTTVLKLMQIMTDKRLLVRDTSTRSHVYRPAAAEEQTQRQLVVDLLERAFGGSARKLVLQALAGGRVPPKKLAQIRRLLDEIEGDRK